MIFVTLATVLAASVCAEQKACTVNPATGWCTDDPDDEAPLLQVLKVPAPTSPASVVAKTSKSTHAKVAKAIEWPNITSTCTCTDALTCEGICVGSWTPPNPPRPLVGHCSSSCRCHGMTSNQCSNYGISGCQWLPGGGIPPSEPGCADA
eukprot:gnl/TRDRNA2_/TRDRNA2_155950_c1_seq2.p2 gnl/TRDRNA2_/TRDRNA2_155950_c1~~gnl/TRDRNA2_/TRDRNA2_155950_c1_seq2.p2  ORF type:complete len:150 (+),score=11.52 gnl/TRDRNA2_/TRDRNA2_155950_c1_seq2:81-530(+)